MALEIFQWHHVQIKPHLLYQVVKIAMCIRQETFTVRTKHCCELKWKSLILLQMYNPHKKISLIIIYSMSLQAGGEASLHNWLLVRSGSVSRPWRLIIRAGHKHCSVSSFHAWTLARNLARGFVFEPRLRVSHTYLYIRTRERGVQVFSHSTRESCSSWARLC